MTTTGNVAVPDSATQTPSPLRSPPSASPRARGVVMRYLTRLARAASGSALIVALYAAAAEPRLFASLDAAAWVLAGSLGIAVIPGAVAAALVRRHPVALLLVAQVLTIAVVAVIWNR